MNPLSATAPDVNPVEWIAWLVALGIMGFGLRFGKAIVAFILDKLYQLLLQQV